MHAGGKFDHGAYKVAGGLHGVGISVVNALSTRVEVDISRDGYTWRQSYDHMVPGTLKRGGATKATGTVVRFWADPTIFETTKYDYETVSRRLQQMAFLNKGLTITLDDERVDTADAEANATPRRTYHYPDGLVDYVKHLNSAHTPVHTSVICFSGTVQGDEDGVEVEVAMQWNAGYSESVHTFANTINTHEGGTHEEGFRSALTTVVNRYAREQKMLKAKDGNLTGEDIREGLVAVVSVKVGEPQFEGRMKNQGGQHRCEVHRSEGLQRTAHPVVGRVPRRCQSAGPKSFPTPRRTSPCPIIAAKLLTQPALAASTTSRHGIAAAHATIEGSHCSMMALYPHHARSAPKASARRRDGATSRAGMGHQSSSLSMR